MKAVDVICGTAAPLMRDHVNTDAIIPATHMRRLTRVGYGDVLFEPWRGTPGFVLDQPEYAGASILLAGDSFGSGSSREHAPWALRDGGFAAVIATSFADIFALNCTKTGLITAALAREHVEQLAALVRTDPHTVLEVSVTDRVVRAEAGRFEQPFPLDDYTRHRLLNGLDDIDTTLQHLDAIADYESRRPTWLPTIQPNSDLTTEETSR